MMAEPALQNALKNILEKDKNDHNFNNANRKKAPGRSSKWTEGKHRVPTLAK